MRVTLLRCRKAVYASYAPVCQGTNTTQFEEFWVELRHPRVDKGHPPEKHLQHCWPTGEREEQTIISVGLVKPHL
jgi:hypothetical protein